MIIEITVLGRGGQGGVTAAELIADAAFKSGYKDVASFPTFGTERRGSPVYAFTRIADQKIWTRQQIYNPDVAVILDETILTPAFINSIKDNGTIVINTDKCASDAAKEFSIPSNLTLAVCNVTHYCIEKNFIIDGQPMVNTPILGVLSRVLDNITMDKIEEVIFERFGEKKGQINMELAKICSENTEVMEAVN